MRAKDSINITTSITTNTSITTSITHEWVWHLIRGTIRLGLDTISSHMKDRRHAGLPFYIDDRRWPCPSIPAWSNLPWLTSMAIELWRRLQKRLFSIITDLFEKSIFYSLMSWRFQLKGWSWLLHARVPLNKANLWYKSENRRSLPAHSFDPLGRLQARRENRAAPWLH